MFWNHKLLSVEQQVVTCLLACLLACLSKIKDEALIIIKFFFLCNHWHTRKKHVGQKWHHLSSWNYNYFKICINKENFWLQVSPVVITSGAGPWHFLFPYICCPSNIFKLKPYFGPNWSSSNLAYFLCFPLDSWPPSMRWNSCFEEFDKGVKECQDKTIFAHFSTSTEAKGKSWCLDCVEDEPAIWEGLRHITEDCMFISCQVGVCSY